MQIVVEDRAAVTHTNYMLLVEKSIHNCKQVLLVGEESNGLMSMVVERFDWSVVHLSVD